MTTHAYLRLSKDDDVAAGIEAQRTAITRFAEASGWTIAEDDWHEELASAREGARRPILDEVTDAMRPGDVLLAARIDRLSRSTVDFGRLLTLAQAQGWQVRTVDFSVDPSTAMGRAMLNIAVTFAQLERDLISERTSAALVEIAKVKHVGRPTPFDDDSRAAVRSIIATGEHSAKVIARTLNTDGYVPANGSPRFHAGAVHALIRAEVPA